MSRKDPVVQARPRCYHCRKPLRPIVTATWHQVRDGANLYSEQGPPFKFHGYGHYGRFCGRFCGQGCASSWALARTNKQSASDTMAELEIERATAKWHRDKARELKRKFVDTIDEEAKTG